MCRRRYSLHEGKSRLEFDFALDLPAEQICEIWKVETVNRATTTKSRARTAAPRIIVQILPAFVRLQCPFVWNIRRVIYGIDILWTGFLANRQDSSCIPGFLVSPPYLPNKFLELSPPTPTCLYFWKACKGQFFRGNLFRPGN